MCYKIYRSFSSLLMCYSMFACFACLFVGGDYGVTNKVCRINYILGLAALISWSILMVIVIVKCVLKKRR